jgi:shikimate dehydrogenase
VILLEPGGGAQGAAAALLGAGASITLANRTPARAEALAARLGAGVTAVGWEGLGPALETADLVLNATSAGFGGAPPLDLPWDRLPSSAAAMDMVYHPLETAFLAEARRRGLTVVDGLEMLIGQARPSFEAFYGAPPPDLDVRALALRALEARG